MMNTKYFRLLNSPKSKRASKEVTIEEEEMVEETPMEGMVEEMVGEGMEEGEMEEEGISEEGIALETEEDTEMEGVKGLREKGKEKEITRNYL